VDVSNTIQPRQYTARQTALHQLRPSAIVEAGEAALAASQGRAFRVVYDLGMIDPANAARSVFMPIAGGTKVAMQSTTWPTTSQEATAADYPAEDSWSRWADQAKLALGNATSTGRRPTTAAARFRVERLTALQAAFGFTIQDLAAVLGITRPQLYKWLDAANEIKLQEASRTRLSAAERFAKEWIARSHAPLSSLAREPLAGGGTAFALLAADAIDEPAVLAAFDDLAAKLQERPRTRSERLRDAGFTRRRSARALPSDE
jgi:hypothetical protein